MNDQITKSCNLLLDSREKIKTVFRWEGGLIHLACAGIYVLKQKEVEVSVLKDCKELIDQKVGIFSNFRGTAKATIASMIAVSENPERTLNNGLTVYQLLKKEFFTSTYLPLTAMVIAQMAEPHQYETIAARTKRIYNQIKEKHPFLTSCEDSANCALLALSEKSDDELINEIEHCYQLLKPNFFSSNAILSLSHVLALGQGTAEEKCRKTMDLFNGLKAAGYKYGTSYELPTLGVMALSEGLKDEIIRDMLEINNWLASQKGFGLFSSVTAKQKLMYSGIVAQCQYINSDTMQSTALNSTISLIIAQEAAMFAAISASAAASSSANASS
ncbi:MAG: DUF4003 family protein [Lachnospiraceae bacterium]|nr:DUF4003 family protein [Lachnospiraceae bacterium]